MPGPQVTAAEIARIAGVGRAAVSNWRRRFPEFPQPVGGTETSPTFSLAEVEGWLREQGKIAEVAPDEMLWRALVEASGDEDHALVLAQVGEHLLLPAPEGRDGPRAPAFHEAARRAEQVGPARVFGELYARYTESAARPAATPPGPAALMTDLATALGPARTVLDPSCGAGDLLLAARRAGHGTEAAAGQDPDAALARLAAVRLAFAATPADPTASRDAAGPEAAESPKDGPSARVPTAPGRTEPAAAPALTEPAAAPAPTEPAGPTNLPAPPTVAVGDALRHDAWSAAQFDAVLCNPPFNDRNWGHDELAYDPRWVYGLPPKTEGELAWVQHALAHARVGGTVAVLMPPAVASRGSGRRIRAELLRSGALRAVVGLPAGAAPPAGVALQVWLLVRPEPGTASSHVLFVDTAAHQAATQRPGPPRSTGAHQAAAHTPDPRRDPDWAAIAELAVDAWRSFASAPAALAEIPGVRRAVPVIDLLDDAVDLTPAHNLPLPAGTESADVVADMRAALADALASVPEFVPDTRRAAPGAAAWRRVAIADLTRGGGVTLFRGPVRTGRGEADFAAAPSAGGPHDTGGSAAGRVLTAADVNAGTAASGVWPAGDGVSDRLTRIEPGDVVVPAVFTAEGTAVRVAEEADAGALLGPNLHLLRPDPGVLDAWFLAGFLAAPANTRQATYGSSIVRLDVRRFEVPLLPLDVQRGYGATFRALHRFNTALGRVGDFGARLGAGLLEGLTSGVLEPVRK
ncbi:N-6 DNA methylase [Yinghuangia sp. YIM S09857]|uniref:N-6 DNA methylase n=1 Tax=Yinghuangia sp. YIM S09857 TaxID=3436929 RepID=UPI003F52C080